jgi:hypothetical protein
MSMLTYTAHRRAELLLDDDDGNSVVFIKDGFSWPAFVIPFVWMIWHRLWLAAGCLHRRGRGPCRHWLPVRLSG